MPSMLTHRVLGDDVLKQNDPASLVMQSIDQAFECYSIGTSGPDLFFFYNAFPWNDGKKAVAVSRHGSRIHQFYTREVFKVMVSRCRKSMDPGQIAYTAGFMMHWALDHIAHPYVYNRCGTGRQSDSPHRFFESQLDRGIIDWKNIDIRKFKPQDIVKYLPDTWYPIWQLYSEVLEKIWNLSLEPEQIQIALQDFHRMEIYLYDPSGRKMKVVWKAEKLAHMEGHATSMIIPVKLDPEWNVMNEDHHLWHHPSTGEEHRESFRELFEEATESGKALLKAFNDVLENGEPLDTVLDLITGNFHTGLPVPDDMKYFDLLQTRVPKSILD